MRIRWPCIAAALLCGICFAASPSRPIPEHCLGYRPSDDAETSWNDAYRRGFRAIEQGRYVEADAEMCRALFAAKNFDPRDWRFAETLDELGLIAFQLRDFERAEGLQGAAIAEMLLAVGPLGEPLGNLVPSERAVIRPDCRSGVRVYTTRLGWIHERVRGNVTVEELRAAPWRIFAAGYVPLDVDLSRRLDWLISQYLLEENLAAAEELNDLQGRIGAKGR